MKYQFKEDIDSITLENKYTNYNEETWFHQHPFYIDLILQKAISICENKT